jgi:outer membrane protein OmpA-like peptidoglycan-associated protein
MKNLLMLMAVVISGCVMQVNQIGNPLSFEVAIKLIANNIFAQQVNNLGPIIYAKKTYYVVDQIIDSDTGEVTKINQHIVSLIMQEAAHNFPYFQVNEMNPQTLTAADFIIVGTVALESYGDRGDKLPHLFLSVVNAKTSQIAARSDVWINNSNLEYDPTPLYKDSPMFIKDRRVDALIATAKSKAGTLANREYFDSLGTAALLDEASDAYDQGNYSLSLGLFAKVAERNDGKVMKTFSGLYQSFFKLRQMDKAEEAFFTLVKLGMQNDNLSVKFLFKVNDTEFTGSGEDLEEYAIWIKQLAMNIAEATNCVQIIGHASRSGSEEYNNKLSLKRAQNLQSRLEAASPEVRAKTKATGRGFSENIIGTGSNDDRDAIDRRVEFKLMPCNQLPN